jgi:diguanylate cyclase (GGDEF)-like protein/PAS domain S-box-containing protein
VNQGEGNSNTRNPAIYAGLYAIAAGLWILLSGKMLAYTVSDPTALAHLELAKGLLFVAVTSAGLYLVLRQRSSSLDLNLSSKRPRSPLLIITALAILVPPAVGYGILRFYTPHLEMKLYEELDAIANLKSGQIDLWREERLKDITSLAASTSLVSSALQITTESADNDSHRRYIENRLASILHAYNYRTAMILDHDGQPLVSVGLEMTLPPATAALIEQTGTSREIVGHLTLSDSAGSYQDLVAPLVTRDHRAQVKRFLLLRSDPERLLSSLMPIWPGYHASGETQIIRSARQDALSYSGPGSDISGHTKSVVINDVSPLASAIDLKQKRHGQLRDKDHRGQDVLASYQALKDSDYAVLAKVDRDESLRPLRVLTAWVGGLLLGAQLVIGVILFILWQQQRRSHQLSLLAHSHQHGRELRQQQAVYFEMFEANPHPMWVYDRHSLRFLAVNDAALQQYGYSREQFLSMRISDIRPAEERTKLENYLTTQPSKGIDNAGLWQHQRRDGSLLTVEISGHPLRFQDYDAEMVLAYDVTHREEMAAQLRESQRFAFATIDALALNIAVLDENFHIIATNAAWRDFAKANGGNPEITGPGSNYAEVCRRAAEHGEPQGQLLLEKLQALGEASIDRFEFEYPCHSPEQQRWFIVQGKRFPGDGSLRLVVTHEAITERKLAELELRQLNRYYAALSNMNASIMRSSKSQNILDQACEIAMQHGELELVWAGRLGADGHSISPLASAGPAAGYLDQLLVSADPKHSHGQGPVGRAIQQGRVIVVNDFYHDPITRPWHEAARHWQLQAALVCPIKCRNGLWGQIAFYSKQRNYFKDKLIALLEELTADLAYGLDMRELERTKAESEARSLLNAQIIESSHEGMYICDADFRINMVNRAFCDITGYGAEALMGEKPNQLFTRREDASLGAQMLSLLQSSGRWDGEIWQRRKNGEYFPAWLSATRVVNEGEVRYIVIYRDITEQKEYQRRIEHSASHDPLTDLPNRGLVDARIDLSIAQARHSGRKVAVIFIDLDRFKVINDSLGHTFGDLLLKAVASRILRVLPDSDLACRVGGDEFMLVLGELANAEQAGRFADTLTRHLARPYHIENHELLITASVGIAMYPGNCEDSANLTRQADIAMASAKQLGRNRYQFYSDEMEADQRHQLELEKALRGAVRRGELFLVYQPQCRLNDGQLIGVEALARWQHPDFGLVPPNRFIPLAEASGLIVELGAWILGEACRQAVQWQVAGVTDVVVSVNVSALQFRQESFVDTVRQTLKASGLAAARLELEITESLLMAGVDQVLLKLEELRALGIKLAIDDFGTGYSSMGYLRQFHAHRLKIDQSFIRKLPEDRDSAAIAQAIVNLGNNMGMQTIAEGIETEAQLAFLKSIDCMEGQGYYFAKPLSPSELEEWLAEAH